MNLTERRTMREQLSTAGFKRTSSTAASGHDPEAFSESWANENGDAVELHWGARTPYPHEQELMWLEDDLTAALEAFKRGGVRVAGRPAMEVIKKADSLRNEAHENGNEDTANRCREIKIEVALEVFDVDISEKERAKP